MTDPKPVRAVPRKLFWCSEDGMICEFFSGSVEEGEGQGVEVTTQEVIEKYNALVDAYAALREVAVAAKAVVREWGMDRGLYIGPSVEALAAALEQAREVGALSEEGSTRG